MSKLWKLIIEWWKNIDNTPIGQGLTPITKKPRPSKPCKCKCNC